MNTFLIAWVQWISLRKHYRKSDVRRNRMLARLISQPPTHLCIHPSVYSPTPLSTHLPTQKQIWLHFDFKRISILAGTNVGASGGNVKGNSSNASSITTNKKRIRDEQPYSSSSSLSNGRPEKLRHVESIVPAAGGENSTSMKPSTSSSSSHGGLPIQQHGHPAATATSTGTTIAQFNNQMDADRASMINNDNVSECTRGHRDDTRGGTAGGGGGAAVGGAAERAAASNEKAGSWQILLQLQLLLLPHQVTSLSLSMSLAFSLSLSLSTLPLNPTLPCSP